MISLYDILEASNGQLFGEPAAHIFMDFCFDARLAGEAQIFVALKTDQGDTHQYMRDAVEKGCLGILCTHPPEFDTKGVSVVIVRDTEAALVGWTRYMLKKLGTQVVCVAGTAGKSLTVEAIARVLAVRFHAHSSKGYGPLRLELPRTLAGLTPEDEFVILELDVTRPGEMAELSQTLHPDVCVITNVGYSHTDAFGALDEIAAEYRLLLDRLASTSLAVLNADDDYTRLLNSSAHSRVLTAGIDSFGADLIAYNVVPGISKTGFDLRYGSERHVGRWIPWLGKHQVYAALAALAVGLHYDVPLDDALRALTELPYLPGRMSPMNGLGNSLIVDDSANASMGSALAALNWMQSVNDERPPDDRNRLVFVLGDMDHLGSFSPFVHRSVGQRAAEVADVFITEGTEAAVAGRAALDKGMDRKSVCTTYSVQDTVATLRDRYGLSAHDVVVVTGGAATRMELVTQALLREEQDRVQLPRQDVVMDTNVLVQPTQLSRVEIDLHALANNVRGIKNWVGEQVAVMAVVKADAYGHGAVSVGRTALLNGAEYLGVSSVGEALELREAGIDAPILVLNYTPVSAVRQAVRQNLTLTLYDLDLARAYDRAARELGAKLPVHVKVDTGMGRLGVMPKEAMLLFRHLYTLNNLDIEGIFTHFASADDDPDFTAYQAKAFRDIIKPLRASGFNFAYIHAANSAGTLVSKDYHFNMVRVGLALYGLSPSESVRVPEGFKPVLTWKTSIAQVKTLPGGHSVGYGRTYRVSEEERIAILPVGYSDGFRRAPRNWGEVLVHGQRAPIIGRVSMEKSAINVSHIPDVSVGDEVVLLGRQGDEVITADDVAARIGTISYEVVTGILPRVRR
jgi:alanine racemase